MAELTTMGFRPGRSIVHRLDARFKLLMLAVISIVTLGADLRGLAVLSALILISIGHIGIPFRSILREMRYFAVLLLLVFIARSLSTPGAPLLSAAGVSITREGVAAGTLVCWRLACIVLAGLIFTTTTRTSEIRGAVIRLFAPVPWIPERRAGTMIGLLVRFIPMILEQVRETADAQRARCAQCRKNPVTRLVKLTVSLLRRIFEDADRLVTAMEARCYNEERTGPSFSATSLDWYALFAMAVVCGGVMVLSLRT